MFNENARSSANYLSSRLLSGYVSHEFVIRNNAGAKILGTRKEETTIFSPIRISCLRRRKTLSREAGLRILPSLPLSSLFPDQIPGMQFTAAEKGEGEFPLEEAIGHELPCNWEQFINLSRQTTRQQWGPSPAPFLAHPSFAANPPRYSSHDGEEEGRKRERDREWSGCRGREGEKRR